VTVSLINHTHKEKHRCGCPEDVRPMLGMLLRKFEKQLSVLNNLASPIDLDFRIKPPGT
jgi:hypothetical protein